MSIFQCSPDIVVTGIKIHRVVVVANTDREVVPKSSLYIQRGVTETALVTIKIQAEKL